MDLPGYDRWKLATPPEYEEDDCPEGACMNCKGTGRGRWRGVCPECNGTGNDTAPKEGDGRLSMEEALELDQEKLDGMHAGEPIDDAGAWEPLP